MNCLVAIPCDYERRLEVRDWVEKKWAKWEMDGHCLPFGLDHGRTDPVWNMQLAYGFSKDKGHEAIAYLHSDVEIYEEGWLERCLGEFADPKVGVVGFGGATRLGHTDLYKIPYQLQQLARFDYHSNTVDADFHGARCDGAMDVATLDGFCLIVRRELLDQMGGWPTDKIQFHNYDNALCCYARRFGWRVRMVGVSCRHLGGGHSVKARWQERCVEDFGMTDAEIHERSHTFLYEEFRDVLPMEVT